MSLIDIQNSYQNNNQNIYNVIEYFNNTFPKII